MPDTLLPILPHVVPFMLVLFRLGGIFIFAPLFGSRMVPAQVKILLALVLAFCIYPMVPFQPVNLSLMTLPVAIGGEVMIGLVIGYGASLPLIAMQMAGMMMGQQIGLGFARVLNPEMNEETVVLGQAFFLIALLVFLLLDGHHALLSALIGSFHHVPLTGYRVDLPLLGVLAGLLSSMYELAVRVAAPLICLIFLETIALGFIARTVPQINILSIGFPLRIIVGGALLVAMAGSIFGAVRQQIIDTLQVLRVVFAP